MVKDVMHDPFFLAIKSEMATIEDYQVALDLLDTLAANKEACVGMAANMIGVRKRIIVFDNEGTYMTMFNPKLLNASTREIKPWLNIKRSLVVNRIPLRMCHLRRLLTIRLRIS